MNKNTGQRRALNNNRGTRVICGTCEGHCCPAKTAQKVNGQRRRRTKGRGGEVVERQKGGLKRYKRGAWLKGEG